VGKPALRRSIEPMSGALIVVLALFAVAGGGIVVLDAFIIRRLRKRG
jgi:hypothetical protein